MSFRTATRSANSIRRILRSAIPVLLALAVPFPIAGDEATPTQLVTGKMLLRELARQRATNLESVPVRNVLSRLQHQSGICLVLDRRVDPSSLLTLSSELVSTRMLLRDVAKRLPESEVSFHRAFVYIGPVSTVRTLRTLIELRRQAILNDRRKFPDTVYARLSATRPFAWPDLCAPRDLLKQQAEASGLTLVNPDMIPHDLWRAGRLPSMPFSEQATLVLSQFDLSFRIHAERAECEIMAMPNEIVIEKRHAVPARRRAELEDRISSRFADADLEWHRSAVRVRATLEVHDQIASLIKGIPDTDDTEPEPLRTQLFTLKLPDDVTYRQLIAHLRQSDLTVHVAAGLEDQLDRTVSVDVSRMPGSAFFPHVFRDLTNEIDVSDDEVSVGPSPE